VLHGQVFSENVCRYNFGCEIDNAFNDQAMFMMHSRGALASTSLLHRRESSHPSIRQILDNVRPEDVFTELLLLNKVQSL
jgi:hypothetical protein